MSSKFGRNLIAPNKASLEKSTKRHYCTVKAFIVILYSIIKNKEFIFLKNLY